YCGLTPILFWFYLRRSAPVRVISVLLTPSLSRTPIGAPVYTIDYRSNRRLEFRLQAVLYSAVIANRGSRNLGSESRRFVVKRLRAFALLIRQPGCSSESELDDPHLLVVTQLLSLRFLHELLINLLIRFIQRLYRFELQIRQF